VLPVPTEARIDIPVIAGDFPKVEDQTSKGKDFKEQKDNSQFHPEHTHPWEFKSMRLAKHTVDSVRPLVETG
jgi:hypothetical protein